MGIMTGYTGDTSALPIAGAPRQGYSLETGHIHLIMRIAGIRILRSTVTVATQGIDLLRSGARQIFHTQSLRSGCEGGDRAFQRRARMLYRLDMRTPRAMTP